LHKGVLLRVMRNNAYLGNRLLNNAIEGLRERLPEGWRLTPGNPARARGFQADAQLTVRAPDGTSAALLVEAKRRVSPRQAAEEAAKLAGAARGGRAAGVLLISDYLSDLSRRKLRSAGVNYIDLTGNAWIALERPGLLIETQGSNQDPSPPRRGVRSLKGPKAARIVRALCDTRPPIRVRELARLSGADPGYVSRLLDLLGSEDLIQRGQAGEIAQTNWRELIRRWGRDYSLTRTNRAVLCLAPRGLEAVADRLRRYKKTYALTGSLAVPTQALVAAGRLVTSYVDDPEQAAGFLEVRPAETGANVLLLEPFDRVVYDRVRTEDGLVKVALSQCAVDLLTGGGRGPAEADALLAWMAEDENGWRS
jgi:hypothetical protein